MRLTQAVEVAVKSCMFILRHKSAETIIYNAMTTSNHCAFESRVEPSHEDAYCTGVLAAT